MHIVNNLQGCSSSPLSRSGRPGWRIFADLEMVDRRSPHLWITPVGCLVSKWTTFPAHAGRTWGLLSSPGAKPPARRAELRPARCFNRVIHSVNNLPSMGSGEEFAPRGARMAGTGSAACTYPHLWISCGYRGVVKWITLTAAHAGRKTARTRRAAAQDSSSAAGSGQVRKLSTGNPHC